jgi:hypothetical protein
LLLRLVLRSPCWLLRLLLAPPRDALPRSLWLLLPLRLFVPRLLLPLDVLPRPLVDEDFELPDFMVNAPRSVCGRRPTAAANPL